MIIAYRLYNSQWRLFTNVLSAKQAHNDVRSWLDGVGHNNVGVTDMRRVTPAFGPELQQSMVVEDPPEDLKMLIKLSFPDVMNVVLSR